MLPVSLWDPPDDLWDKEVAVGDRAWVAGSIQRRFWAAEEGRRSRLELVAQQVQVRLDPDDLPEVRVGAGEEMSGPLITGA